MRSSVSAEDAASAPEDGFLRFFPPRDPRRRFFGPEWPSAAPELGAFVFSDAVSSAKPLLSMEIPFSRRTRGRAMRAVLQPQNWRNRPFRPKGTGYP